MARGPVGCARWNVASRHLVLGVGTFLLMACAAATLWYSTRASLASEGAPSQPPDDLAAQESGPPESPAPGSEKRRVRAPELLGGVEWLNTTGPIRLRDLRGKVVLLDFWTYCCINCIHTLPDLARLERKYANQLVVIGVHSGKYDQEHDSESIRKAILRYEITHPVVNDAEMKIWNAYGVRAWPSLVLIDPEGYLYARGSGEGLYEGLDRAISKLVAIHRAGKTLDERPRRLGMDRPSEAAKHPIYFPGKVLADRTGGRLFIADSTHHRIVVTGLDGRKVAIAGTGRAGFRDGPFAQAQFNDPQGMALRGATLYVADRKNHLIRALDLDASRVRTVAGTGEQGFDRQLGGPARRVGLNSPWDLYLTGPTLYVAMAGFHQIWAMDLDKDRIRPFAGNGREDLVDGPLDQASFAQPSGLTGDGSVLFVADSEDSGIRVVPLDGQGEVRTLVGAGLFEFGDRDGTGDKVRLQHALGVAFHAGLVYVADTYNSKIKAIDPASRICRTIVGGKVDGSGSPVFSEPCGLSFAGDRLYVADTNAHRIRVVDVKTHSVSTLELKGVSAPQTSP